MDDKTKKRLETVKSEARRIVDCMNLMLSREVVDRDLIYLMENKASGIARKLSQVKR